MQTNLPRWAQALRSRLFEEVEAASRCIEEKDQVGRRAWQVVALTAVSTRQLLLFASLLPNPLDPIVAKMMLAPSQPQEVRAAEEEAAAGQVLSQALEEAEARCSELEERTEGLVVQRDALQDKVRSPLLHALRWVKHSAFATTPEPCVVACKVCLCGSGTSYSQTKHTIVIPAPFRAGDRA
jgi:hypothetical protein